MDINQANNILEQFPFLQSARIARIAVKETLSEQDRIELYLYRGNPFLLSYYLKNNEIFEGELSKQDFANTFELEVESEPQTVEKGSLNENTVLEINQDLISDVKQYTETGQENKAENDVIENSNNTIEEEKAQFVKPLLEPEIIATEKHAINSISEEKEVVADLEIKTELEDLSNEELINYEEPPKLDNENYTKSEEIVLEHISLEEPKESFYEPVFTSDIFLHDGIKVDNEIDDNFVHSEQLKKEVDIEDDNTSLMVTRTFSEWLHYYKEKKKKDEQENREKQSLRAMWQKEKLTAAIEEENEVVPEQVFKMAINSISDESIVPSESLAEIYVNQYKYDKAIETYRKLSLLDKEKSAYFASKIKDLESKLPS